MDLFEIFRKKEIKIEPGKNISVEYLFSEHIWDVFPKKGDALLFIKKELCSEDVRYIMGFDGPITVKAEEPKDLDVLDLIDRITSVSQYEEISNICLNYAHVNDTLYIFSEASQIPSVPNIVKLYPMKRTDIETLYKNPVMIKEMTIDEPDKEGQQTEQDTNEKDSQSQTTYISNDNIVNEMTEKNSENVKELKLILLKLKQLFDEKYTVISIEVKGGAVERKTISLTEFYSDNGISSGRLKGSWNLFSKEDIEKNIEPRILGRAMDELNKEYVLTIGGYGKIIEKTKIDEYLKMINDIVKDYVSYLSKGNISKIGKIDIKIKFNPQEMLKSSLKELEEYLLKIRVKDEGKQEYEDNIKNFTSYYLRNGLDFAKDIRVNTRELTFTENQWQNRDFLEKLLKSVVNDKKAFFNSEFKDILFRYDSLIVESGLRYYRGF